MRTDLFAGTSMEYRCPDCGIEKPEAQFGYTTTGKVKRRCMDCTVIETRHQRDRINDYYARKRQERANERQAMQSV